MLNNDIIKHISTICKNENIQYDELVVALCQPKLYRLLSEIIMVLMRNDVPVEHVEAVYFYHQGTSPLEHHSLLPELAMSSISGECYDRILRSNRQSTNDYTNICRDAFIRYWFSGNTFKHRNAISSYTDFKPFTLHEVEKFQKYIAKNLDYNVFCSLSAYRVFDVDSFSFLLNNCYIKKLDTESSKYLMVRLYSSQKLSKDEKETFADVLIRATNKHNLLYGDKV